MSSSAAMSVSSTSISKRKRVLIVMDADRQINAVSKNFGGGDDDDVFNVRPF